MGIVQGLQWRGVAMTPQGTRVWARGAQRVQGRALLSFLGGYYG